MTDYINRQELLENLNRFAYEKYDALVNDLIVKQPSADVRENVKGEWIPHKLKPANVQWGYDCSACGEWYVIDRTAIYRYKYCPNCGADMRGES